jgi:hypothetical protein
MKWLYNNALSKLCFAATTGRLLMQINYCTNMVCGRPFQVNQFKTRIPPPFDAGKIVCPHCGAVSAADSTSVFLTHALSKVEEHEYNLRKVSPAGTLVKQIA